MTTVSVQVKMTDTMKQHLDMYAAARKLTLSELIRSAAAKETAYNLEHDDALEGRGRPRKYNSDEERKRAQNDRARERALHARGVMRAVQKQERLEGAQALMEYLRSKGYTVDEDGNITDPGQAEPEPSVAV